MAKQTPKNPREPNLSAGARHAVDYTARKARAASGAKDSGAQRFRSREKNVTGEGKPVYRREERWSPDFANPARNDKIIKRKKSK